MKRLQEEIWNGGVFEYRYCYVENVKQTIERAIIPIFMLSQSCLARVE